MKRTFYKIDTMDDITREEALQLKEGHLAPRLLEDKSYTRPVKFQDANVVSSSVAGKPGMHAPVLDIDFQADLIPSSTPGHFHLYLDTEVPWDKYVALLRSMEDCGILSKGYVAASIARGATFVRKPGVYKTKSSTSS